MLAWTRDARAPFVITGIRRFLVANDFFDPFSFYRFSPSFLLVLFVIYPELLLSVRPGYLGISPFLLFNVHTDVSHLTGISRWQRGNQFQQILKLSVLTVRVSKLKLIIIAEPLFLFIWKPSTFSQPETSAVSALVVVRGRFVAYFRLSGRICGRQDKASEAHNYTGLELEIKSGCGA